MYKKMYLMAMIITIAFCLYSLYQQWKESTTQIKSLLLIILIAIIFVASRRTTYLPFLGETVLPSSFLKLENNVPDGATFTKTITLKENEKGEYLLYWAAEPNKENNIPNVKTAYNTYSNSGVVKITGNTVDLIVRKPDGYQVCIGYYLEPHIHYRIVKGNMLGEVQTVFL